MANRLPIPLVLRSLIESNNELLNRYKEQLYSNVLAANSDLMGILGLSEKDGWRIDMAAMEYVQEDKPTE